MLFLVITGLLPLPYHILSSGFYIRYDEAQAALGDRGKEEKRDSRTISGRW